MAPAPRPPLDKRVIACGLLAIGLGCIPLLIVGGVIPVKSGPDDPPAVIIVGAGLAFIAGGLAAVFQALGRASPKTGELPADAPLWRRRLQLGLALAVVVILASVGSWIAFGPGEREFSVTAGGIGGPAGSLVGRIAFGVGSALTWLVALFIGLRLFRR
jgi:hypothetical protein